MIGAWDYADASWGETDGPEDSHHGHGSHTASTAAGNILTATLYSAYTDTVFVRATISGAAPHANIISYDICKSSCYPSDVIAALQQAILDGVDVLNESISISGHALFGPKQVAYLDVFNAGIVAVRSAGNSGPGAGSAGAAGGAQA